MNVGRLHSKFGFLLNTGRTFCGGGFNLQNLPKEKQLLDQDAAAVTVRGTFVPAPDHVFIIADFGQIELVTLAYPWSQQLRSGSSLSTLINSGSDIHQLLAAAVLGKPAEQVTKAERNSVKAVSFGLPGGMTAPTLQKIAKNNYELDLDLAAVEQRIDKYHELCPELDRHLTDEINRGAVLARTLNLTRYDFYGNTSERTPMESPANLVPADWLGWKLLRVLRDPVPMTTGDNVRPYTIEELAYFWRKARELPLSLPAKLQQQLEAQQPSVPLWKAVSDFAGRRSVFTVTGRLRANATFCAARNTLFQGAAADGAVLGLWNVWRGGHRIVNFVHDEIVVETPSDSTTSDRAADVKAAHDRRNG